ncbi:MAG: hypothetical protein AAF928_02420 [Myxococcota bacterium]
MRRRSGGRSGRRGAAAVGFIGLGLASLMSACVLDLDALTSGDGGARATGGGETGEGAGRVRDADAFHCIDLEDPRDKKIEGTITMRNTGNLPLTLARTKVRYYFSAGDEPDLEDCTNVFFFDDVGCDEVTFRTADVGPVGANEKFLELGFVTSAPVLGVGEQLGIKFALSFEPDGTCDLNDPSYGPNVGACGASPSDPGPLTEAITVHDVAPDGAERVLHGTVPAFEPGGGATCDPGR